MKKTVCILFAGIVASSVHAQTTLVKHEWRTTLKVVDEAGSPLAGVKASVGYFSKSQPSSIDGLTDTNGLFVASHEAYSGELGFTAQKIGYYTTTEKGYDLGYPYDYLKWNPNPILTLKKTIKPIPMCAKRICSQPPDNGKPVGYDMEAGDWIAPYGNGINTDIIFTREYKRKSFQDYEYKLTVNFPNPEDGIQEFTPYSESELKSPHEAPTNGYQPNLVRLNISHPGQKLIFDYDKNRAYFIRVRTRLDARGSIVSAHYGKIYGDFMNFTYYLNPTPNSRNIEFDPKRNLIKNLPPLERVSAP